MQLDIFMAEVFGTMILILLGDGVVAGVLLAKSKANSTPAGSSSPWRGPSRSSPASWWPGRSAAPT